MAITSTDIQNQSFKIERRGYDVDEVDVFLERVAAEIDTLNNEISQLRLQLADAQQAAPVAAAVEAAPTTQMPSVDAVDSAELAAKDAQIAELEAKLRERKSDDSAIAQALIVAQRTADEIVAKAKGEAEQTRINSEEEGKRILDKANAEKQKVVDHINQLSASREQVREQYQDMLKEFISQATHRLSEIGGEPTSGIEIPAELLEGTKPTDASSAAVPAASASWNSNPSVATYTTPTVNSVAAAPATPKPSAQSKDFSGYGDADDSFAFDEID